MFAGLYFSMTFNTKSSTTEIFKLNVSTLVHKLVQSSLHALADHMHMGKIFIIYGKEHLFSPTRDLLRRLKHVEQGVTIFSVN